MNPKHDSKVDAAQMATSLTQVAVKSDPSAAAEALLKTVLAEIQVSRTFKSEDFINLCELSANLTAALGFMPLPAKKLARLLEKFTAEIDQDTRTDYQKLTRELEQDSKDALAQIHFERQTLALAAASEVFSKTAVVFFGYGPMQKQIIEALVSRFGSKLLIFICQNEVEGLPFKEQAAFQIVEDLTKHLKHHFPTEAIPSKITPLGLSQAGTVFSGASQIFLVALGVDPYGTIVLPPGGEKVYQMAIDDGPGVSVLVNQDDLLSTPVSPSPEYAVVTAGPGVTYVTYPDNEITRRKVQARGLFSALH